MLISIVDRCRRVAKAMDSSFLHAVEWAFRMALATVFSSIFCLSPWGQNVSVCFLALVVSTIQVFPTFGETLAQSFQLVYGSFCGTVTCFVLLQALPIHQDLLRRAVYGSVLFVVVFVVAFMDMKAVWKKLFLLMASLGSSLPL